MQEFVSSHSPHSQGPGSRSTLPRPVTSDSHCYPYPQVQLFIVGPNPVFLRDGWDLPVFSNRERRPRSRQSFAHLPIASLLVDLHLIILSATISFAEYPAYQIRAFHRLPHGVRSTSYLIVGRESVIIAARHILFRIGVAELINYRHHRESGTSHKGYRFPKTAAQNPCSS